MDDEKIIGLFISRSEQAIKELDQTYGKLLHKLSYNILQSHQDAEECVNDTYLGIWNTIPPQHPSPLLPYLCKIVRNISITRYHSNAAKKRNSTYAIALEELQDCLPAPNTVETEIEAAALTYTINAFLQTLSPQNRVIFLRRYWFSDTYRQIASSFGISEALVSVRLTRIRKKLKEYLTQKEFLP